MRSRSVERFRRRPAETQRKERDRLRRECARTEFGRRYGFGEIRTPEAFAQRVERFDYTSFKPYVERMMAGEADVAAPGRVRWFARSSGTTSDRSKYIPVTMESLSRTLEEREAQRLRREAEKRAKEPKKKGHSHDNNQNNNRMNNSMNSTGGMFNNFR